MKHLDESQLVDLIDGRLDARVAEHADECDACRARVTLLREALSEAKQDEGFEPSPLFWDHFAARVADAVRDEAPLPAAPGWTGWLRNPATAWATTASIAVLLMVGALWRATLNAPMFPTVTTARPPSEIAAPAVADDLDADRAWAVVRSAADDLAWEDVTAAGLTAHPGAAEGVALELTADERRELARLIASDMKSSGS